MAISRIGQATAQSSTITIPGTYAAGDLMVIVGTRANTTPATIPSGWVALATNGANGVSIVGACKYAQSASESAPTFTNAGILLCAVYRSSLGVVIPSMGVSAQGATSATINYGSLASYRAGVDANWYLAFAAQLNTANSLETALTGATNVNFDSITGLKVALHESGNQLSNWAPSSPVLANSAAYRSASVQIAEMAYTFPSGGGFRPVNIRGGADQ